MGYRAVVDACVLYPFGVRDTLLALAEEELYDVLWSERILEEMRRNVVLDGRMTEEGAASTLRAMSTAFQDATVPEEAIKLREPVMTNHPKDRHVLAAAVAGGADVIVTTNLRDFAVEHCAPRQVRAVHPDEFLLTLLVNDRNRVVGCLQNQVRGWTRPPVTLEQHLDGLSKTVPEFAAAARA